MRTWAKSPSLLCVRADCRARLCVLTQPPSSVEKSPNEFGNLLCCCGVCMALASFGITTILQPIQTCNPRSTVPSYELQLDDSAVQLKTAVNDCCFHIAHATTTVPLDKIQDVQLQETWYHTLFGVKQVNIQTAGMNTNADGVAKPEISAAFLRDPERVRESIALAARLHKEAMSAPGQAAMRRNAAPGMIEFFLVGTCLSPFLARHRQCNPGRAAVADHRRHAH